MDAAIGSILAAAVVTAPPTLMAALAWRKGKENAENIGQKNGHGSVTDMGGALLTAFETHADLDTERFDRMEESHRRLESKIDRIDRTLGTNRAPYEGDSDG